MCSIFTPFNWWFDSENDFRVAGTVTEKTKHQSTECYGGFGYSEKKDSLEPRCPAPIFKRTL